MERRTGGRRPSGNNRLGLERQTADFVSRVGVEQDGSVVTVGDGGTSSGWEPETGVAGVELCIGWSGWRGRGGALKVVSFLPVAESKTAIAGRSMPA